MKIFYLHILWGVLGCLVLTACSSSDPLPDSRKHFQQGEYIYRSHDEISVGSIPLEKHLREAYPWEKNQVGPHLSITKEFFRCKGTSLNPARAAVNKGENLRYYDCGGSEKHSLPLRNQKEFIYPILIELLNYIQLKTEKRVVITSGHRCPEHNIYVDPSSGNASSKHLIGAEVSFYVQGLEFKPEQVIQWIQNYYRDVSFYAGQKDYLEFKRYEKDDVNVSTQPWCNKEIFVKLFKVSEGRNFDNRHPYPYISVQVRYDKELNEKVVYSWDKAYHNYLRK